MTGENKIVLLVVSTYIALAIILLICTKTLAAEEIHRERHIDNKPDSKLPSIGENRRKRQADSDSEDSDNQQTATGPGPVEIKTFSSLARGVRCRGMKILDEKTMEIEELDYDGEGPAAWFMVGNHANWDDEFVDLGGTIIPDENGNCDLLREYVTKDIKLTLPGDMKWSDFNYLSIFCLRFNHNFGSVGIPDNMKLPNGTGKGTNLEECNQDPDEAVDPDSSGPRRPRPRPSGARPSGGSGGGGSGGGDSGGGGGGGILGGLINILG